MIHGTISPSFKKRQPAIEVLNVMVGVKKAIIQCIIVAPASQDYPYILTYLGKINVRVRRYAVLHKKYIVYGTKLYI
jgi:hypothetical protein